MKPLYTIIISIIFCLSMSAQTPCGTGPLNLTNAKKIADKLNQRERFYDGQRLMVRLALHRITASNGTGGFTWNEINDWVSTLPNAFAEYNICFTVIHREDIMDNSYNNMTSFSGTLWEDLIEENRVTNAINIYFVENADKGGIATGFLFLSPTIFPTVTIARSVNGVNIFNTPVLAHEIGHCLGLLHTHEDYLCVENIERTGSNVNCETCGDELCDTPADHNLVISSSNVNDANCQYIGGRSRNGLPYNPDTRNIMSYTLPACMLNFTEGQGNRMRNYMLNTGELDDIFIPFNRLVAGTLPINGNNTSYWGVENDIYASFSNGIFYVPLTITSTGDVTFEASNEIMLNDGFEAQEGSNFYAKIGLYSCNNPGILNAAKTDETYDNVLNYSIERKVPIVYPNPFSSELILRLPFSSFETAVVITNINGQVVLSRTLDANITNVALDVSQTIAGIYFVTIVSNEQRYNYKLVKE